MLRMRVPMSCSGIAVIRLAAPIEAPESLLVVRYELPSVCLENPIHARWDSDPEIVPANPYVQYPHSLRAVQQYCAMTWCIVVHEKDLQTHSASKRRTYGRRISLQ
ncbi:hypothetical protein TNCV_2062261 [Trichonephila clavipes]|nr:hypothetical protein TNCV_2062261 [Trichonephila clavipes]